MVVEWFGIADGVLQHMRCSTELWVSVATSAMQSMGKKWWKSAHSTYFKSRQLERIAWLEFEGILYAQYFTSTAWSQMKIEFQALEQRDVIVAAY